MKYARTRDLPLLCARKAERASLLFVFVGEGQELNKASAHALPVCPEGARQCMSIIPPLQTEKLRQAHSKFQGSLGYIRLSRKAADKKVDERHEGRTQELRARLASIDPHK